MRINLQFFITGLFFYCIDYHAKAQSFEGTSLIFGYNVGSGNWENFNNVLDEYRTIYPYFTDNENLSNKKQGFVFGFNIVEEKKFADVYLGGMKATAWSCGFAPTGSDVCETYLVKS